MADLCILFFNTVCWITSYFELLSLQQNYSYMYGHWALYSENWPEEVSTWIFCYNDMLFNSFVFTNQQFGWYWWPDNNLRVGYVFRVESPTSYLFDWFNQRQRVAFFQSDSFYSATDNTFGYAKIQRFYFEQQILCDYHFDGGNPEPNYTYTNDTYYLMFFFTWFTMSLVATAVYTFDLF